MQRSARYLALLASLVLVGMLAATVQAAPRADLVTAANPSFRIERLPAEPFTAPIWVGNAPGSGNTVYVAEQGGRIYAVNGTQKRLFLDLSRTIATGGEQGLLSVAFSRDYTTSGRFYVYVTQPDGNGQVRQYLARSGRVTNGSMRVVLDVPLSPPVATNHNGGNLWAGPRGLLYLSVGDGGGGGVEVGNSQRMNRLMGKLLRIAPRATGGYVVPRTNPFFARSGARREIFALGLRNPWRFSIDEPTGDIWIGDVGQSDREEIDRLRGGAPAGANFGWPRMEGNRMFSSSTPLAPRTTYARPFLDYSHASGGCSVTGGVVYRGPVSSLRGWYLFADYCTDTITAVNPATGRRTSHAGVGGIVHFGQVSGGSVLVASVTDGNLYRIVAR